MPGLTNYMTSYSKQQNSEKSRVWQTDILIQDGHKCRMVSRSGDYIFYSGK
jgi:hypothetical protein